MSHRHSASQRFLVSSQKNQTRGVSSPCARNPNLERRVCEQPRPRKDQPSRQGRGEASRRLRDEPRRPSQFDDETQSKPGQHFEESSPSHSFQAGKREDSVSLRKHLDHARHLASAIKQGQCYLHLLQKEEEEERQRMKRENQLRKQRRPLCFASSEEWSSASWSGWIEGNRRKNQTARPFTPIHYSLTSPLLTEAPREIIYRQLCCLNWLLEALNQERTDRVGPLTSCWDLKDPGRGTATKQMLNREKALEIGWEQFVSGAKHRRSRTRLQRSASSCLHIRRRSSVLSVASLSALTITTMGSSQSSLLPGAEEETELPTSEYPQSLLEAVNHNARRDVSTRATDGPISATSQMVYAKARRLHELRAAFEEKMESKAQKYVDSLELKARQRLNSLQKYQAYCRVSQTHQIPHHVTCTLVTQAVTQENATMESEDNNKESNNMWLSSLLKSLPVEVCKERPVRRVLEKLSGFAGQQKIRVRPQRFLTVLGGLEPWELCLPELCVAIEIVREHAVHLARDEYDAWLQSRVSLPPQFLPAS